LIIDLRELKIYDQDRIGIVGVNGVGKTTLLNLLSGRLKPDEGWVKVYTNYSFIAQLDPPECRTISTEMASKFKVAATWSETMSGGEKTRFKIAQSIGNSCPLIFADEPTSNVDLEGIELLENLLVKYPGALVLISHDRNFLDRLCNKIVEIENGQIKLYNGNYSDYSTQKALEREREQFEYLEYLKEKRRLEEAVCELQQKSHSVKKTPKRMGNSEARLHKRGRSQKAKATLDRARRSVASRLEHLQQKEKPLEQEVIKLTLSDSQRVSSKIIIEGTKLNKAFGAKVIFKEADFRIVNGSKTAIIGANGSGKSTLLKMIVAQEQGIRIAPAARIGYFSQDMSILDDCQTILANVMATSVYPENDARLLLSRLLFKREAVFKPVNLLSGGERVKVSFAKILLQGFNVLILDEPTNYLDLLSLQVVEAALQHYDGTLLFVSHDRRFISQVANQIMTIEDHRLKIFTGSYNEYLASRNQAPDNRLGSVADQIIILEHRLAELTGRISGTTKQDELETLDKEFYETVDELRRLKNLLETKR
jgi:macrolide transport system ATP-binding/permease protein